MNSQDLTFDFHELVHFSQTTYNEKCAHSANNETIEKGFALAVKQFFLFDDSMTEFKSELLQKCQ